MRQPTVEQLEGMGLSSEIVLPYVTIRRLLNTYEITGRDGRGRVLAADATQAIAAAAGMSWTAAARIHAREGESHMRALYEVFVIDPGTKGRKGEPARVLAHEHVIAANESTAVLKAASLAKIEDIDHCQTIVRAIGTIQADED